VKVGAITLSSSDTKEALDLLSLSPTRHPCSQSSNLRSGSDSDVFEGWPEANDMDASVYVALIADALSSRASMVGGLHNGRDSCAGGSSDRWSHLRTTSSKKPRWRKSALTGAPWRKSKK
jgi:hypothetical protein